MSLVCSFIIYRVQGLILFSSKPPKTERNTFLNIRVKLENWLILDANSFWEKGVLSLERDRRSTKNGQICQMFWFAKSGERKNFSEKRQKHWDISLHLENKFGIQSDLLFLTLKEFLHHDDFCFSDKNIVFKCAKNVFAIKYNSKKRPKIHLI